MKENQNLFDMNLWSGGEYDNSLNNIQCIQNNQKCIITKDYSVNGETSFKLSRGGGTGYNWTRFLAPCTEKGKTMTAKLKIYTPNAEVHCYLCDMNGSTEGNHTGAYVIIYPSNKIQEITLTYTGTLSTLTHYAIRIMLQEDGTYCFIDDICLTSN